nr:MULTISPECIES: VCBS repeat-containing protein [Myxococcaceae]
MCALGAAAAPRAEPAPSPALERLADALAQELRARHPEPPLALHVSAASPALARALGTLLAARLEGLAPVVLEAPSPKDAEALAREQGLRSLARLALSLEAGEVRARGDLLGTWVNFWSGRTPTRPPAPAAALARAVPADAPALALAAAPAEGPPAPHRGPVRLLAAPFAQLPGRTGALAAGDLDGDGRDEVAALVRLPSGAEEVVVLDAGGQVRARHALSALAPSATPPREPFGALAFQASPRRLLARSAAREAGEALVLGPPTASGEEAQLLPQARLEGPLPLDAALRAPLQEGGRALVGPELAWGPAPLRAAAPFVTAALAPGGGAPLVLVHPDGAASLYAAPGAAPRALAGLGAGSALVDVDGDGAPELLTTEPAPLPSPERLRVFDLPGSGALGAPRGEAVLARGRALQVVAARLEPGTGPRGVLVALWLEDGTTELTLLRPVAP